MNSLNADGFALLRSFVADREIGRLRVDRSDLRVHRCHAGNDVSWSEATVLRGHPGHDLFLRPDIRCLVAKLARREIAPGIKAWMSIYREGEFITPHRDSDGLIQMLVCLESPRDASSGGALILGAQAVILAPGDAVVFKATEVEHYTTPLLATETDPDPARSVLVWKVFPGGGHVALRPLSVNSGATVEPCSTHTNARDVTLGDAD